MKGNNELVLNQATMIEAVQYWLDSRMVQPAPKVTGVVWDASNGSDVFSVTLDADADRSDPKKTA